MASYLGTGQITTANIKLGPSGNIVFADGTVQTTAGGGSYSNVNVQTYLPTYTGNLSPGNLDVQTAFYIGGTAFTRTLTVGTRSSPVTVPLASNNSFNVLSRTGNVSIYTT